MKAFATSPRPVVLLTPWPLYPWPTRWQKAQSEFLQIHASAFD